MGRLPDFLVIGAQRAGTTSFYEYLTRHPEIEAAAKKELHYFSLFYSNGDRWYRKQFPRRRRGRITGEATPYYIFHPAAAARARELVPDAKLIVLLRDPVERAYSQYQHSVKRGWETLPFEEAIRDEPLRLAGEEERLLADPTYRSFAHQHLSYVARGRYVEQLPRWTDRFGTERLLVLSSERLFESPPEVLTQTFAFLEVGTAHVGPFEPRNVSTYGSQMEPMVREELQRYFAPYNERLFDLLDDDLGWKA